LRDDPGARSWLGVGANVGLGYARNASGRMNALEPIPLAVSFA
jgi:hypothetical protein